ncbi:Myelin-associated oligodendrocyte basic protein [Quillaja saponaria]|uniref:Myelin-associated oligodendrocyte basic protein n=1 Tax=Quillaja saponaria TaxID=32244 RepID=A0AAD7Q285_QUISA|nr:Myelin-associated oligodendrocyte basic protein [Quillaja saponaria]
MATASLLEANPLKWKQSFPIQFLPRRSSLRNHIFIKTDKFSATLNAKGSFRYNVKCFFSQKHLTNSSTELCCKENSKNSTEVIADSILNALKALRKPAIAAVLLGLLLMFDPSSALAASGGRMGGRSFSSHSSSSYSSRGYSVPSSPSSGFSYSAPYYAPSPLGFSGGGGGFYFGPAVGLGVGAGSSFFFILVGFAAFILVSGFLSDRSESSLLTATQKTTVLKLQVGLLGMGRSLQKDLNRIAETADKSSSEGLSYILAETTLSLLRHPDYCISGYSSVDLKRSIEDGEKRFNQLSIEEQGKFDEETLMNVNNIKKLSTTSQRSNGFSNEYIVITILVAAEGVQKVPAINGSGDLKEALQKVGSIPSSKLLAVEVLWTPQNENDTLSERELLEDYPLLRPL